MKFLGPAEFATGIYYLLTSIKNAKTSYFSSTN